MPHSQAAQVVSFSNGLSSCLLQQGSQDEFQGVLGTPLLHPAQDHVLVFEHLYCLFGAWTPY